MECKLRPWRITDAADLVATLNNQNILKNLNDGIPYPYTLQDAREYITSMIEADDNDTFAFAITLDDRVIGSISAFRQSHAHRLSAEVGYYLAEAYWGRGIVPNVLRQLSQWIFEDTDIVRLFAIIYAFNTSSARVLQKCNFRHEGTLRQSAVKQGVILDTDVYALLRDERL